MAAYRSSGTEVTFLETSVQSRSRDQVALACYTLGWPTGGITIRMDDDDGMTPDFMERLGRKTAKWKGERHAWMFPEGIRVWGDLYVTVRHETNAWVAFGDPHCNVYTFRHRLMKSVCPVTMIDEKPAWLWLRHQDTISQWRKAMFPLNDKIRALFPVDWGHLATLPRGTRKPGGEVFP